jgi:hypothetical protein
MLALDQEPFSYGFILSGLRRSIDNLELEFARFLTEFVKSQEWDHEGFNTPADWMRFNCHMTSGQAWSSLQVAEEQARLGRSLEAMKEGEIGFAHLATLAGTARAVGPAFDEDKLLGLARKHSPGKFHYQCQHYRHAVDAAAYNRDQEGLAEARSLRLSTAQDGCLLISGLLDPVGGAAVRSALEPLAQPAGADDDRPLDVRQADALVDLACGGRPAELQVTATIETLKGLAGAAGGEMEFSVPLASAGVQRLACDCSVTRVLLDQSSLVVDVGRSRRVVDGALRKALVLRDKHCQWPGCERPASYCDGHHLVHWIDGGETNLDNCVLLYRRHHRLVHEGGWQLLKLEGKIVTVAPTITFGSLARGPD